MCINCLSNLENWEEFKQKCISSNECIQNCIKQLEEEKLNMTVDNSIKHEDQLEINEQENNHDSMLNNEFNNQDSDNDSSKSKSSISPIVMRLLPIIISWFS